MKLFNLFFGLFIGLFVVWKLILPYLFSQKSDAAIVSGCAIILVIAYYTIKFVITRFTEEKE